jgi:hypothetical protein
MAALGYITALLSCTCATPLKIAITSETLDQRATDFESPTVFVLLVLSRPQPYGKQPIVSTFGQRHLPVLSLLIPLSLCTITPELHQPLPC